MVVEASVDGEEGEGTRAIDEPFFDGVELKAAEENAGVDGAESKDVCSAGSLERKEEDVGHGGGASR